MTDSNYTPFELSLKKIEDALLALISRLGPFFVALIPAMFTAYSVYHTFTTEDDPIIKWSFALITAIGIEVSGIKIIHTAVDMYRAGNGWKAAIMTLSSIAYAVVVALIILYAEDSFTPIMRNLGIGSPFLAMMVYLAVAYSREVEHVETHQQTEESEDKSFEREFKMTKLQLSHQQKIAQINAPKSVPSPVPSGTPVAQDDTPKIERAKQILVENQGVPIADLVRQTDISRRTFNRANGALNGTVETNGKG